MAHISIFNRYLLLLALLPCASSNAVSNAFLGDYYQKHNLARQDHLATLDLPLAGKSVIELGAGIGDHTDFFLSRGCQVLASDAREDVVQAFRQRHPSVPSHVLDLDAPPPQYFRADVVYAYGILYHLKQPGRAIEWMARHASQLLLLETCVQLDTAHAVVSQVEEARSVPTEAFHGVGSRPSRTWVFQQLKRHFPYVYLPQTQPNHMEFPVNWEEHRYTMTWNSSEGVEQVTVPFVIRHNQTAEESCAEACSKVSSLATSPNAYENCMTHAETLLEQVLLKNPLKRSIFIASRIPLDGVLAEDDEPRKLLEHVPLHQTPCCLTK